MDAIHRAPEQERQEHDGSEREQRQALHEPYDAVRGAAAPRAG